MNWHTSTITRNDLDRLLAEIYSTGGTITSCKRCATGLLFTWFTRSAA